MSDSSSVSSKPIGVSGVVHYAGIIVPAEYDRAWKGIERDKTIASMANDPLIGAVLMGIEFLVRRIDWRVAPADDSTTAEDVATFVQECLDDMEDYWPGDTLAKVLTYLPWGWSCMEVVYKRRSGPDASPPSRFADGKVGWHRWALRPQATRFGWQFAGDDPVALIQQDPQTYQRLPIPLAKCILFRYASRDNSPEGFTPLRVAFDAWYNKRKLQRIEAIGIERDLAGLPVYYLPGADIKGNTLAYQAAQTITTNLRNDAQAGAVIPGDRDASGNRYHELALLSTGGSRSFDTDPIIKRYANEVVTVFLANVMRAGQDGVGSFALAETQGGLFQQAIGAHLDTIAQAITEQAIAPLCRLNGITPDLMPTLEHGDIESADLARLGAYLTSLAQAGMLVDTPELRSFLHEVAGLPVPTAEEIADQQAQEEADAAQARQDALKAAQAAQDAANGGDGADTGDAASTAPTMSQNGKATAMTEPVRLVEDDGALTLSDLMEVVAWWDATVPAEFRGLLNAKVVGGDG